MLKDLTKRNITNLFKATDRDNDGFLTKKDYQMRIDSFAIELNLSKESAEYTDFEANTLNDWYHLQKYADLNGNGKIDLNEWINYFDEMLQTEEGYEIVAANYAERIGILLANKETGLLSIEEYKILLRCYGFGDYEADQSFEKLDTNGNNFISPSELIEATRQWISSDNAEDPGHWLFGPPSGLPKLVKRNLSHLFYIMDRDRDGYLAKQDYESLIESMAHYLNVEKESSSFTVMEAHFLNDWARLRAHGNGKGLVDLSEWLSYFQKMLNCPEGYQSIVKDYGEKVSAVIDSNGDGLISLSDYKGFLHAYGFNDNQVAQCFAKIDLDKTNSLSNQEWLKAIHQWLTSDNPEDAGHWLFGPPSSLGRLVRRNIINLFNAMDRDGDGALSKGDYVTIVQSFAKNLKLDETSAKYTALEAHFLNEWAEIRQHADTNSNGTVDLNEWLTYFDAMLRTSQGYQNLVTNYAKKLGAVLDVNNNGAISLNEYSFLLRAYGCDETQAAQCFSKIDTNSDGLLSQDELVLLTQQWASSDNADDPGHWLFGPPTRLGKLVRRNMIRLFHALDRDGDGQLEKDDCEMLISTFAKEFKVPKNASNFTQLESFFLSEWAELKAHADKLQRCTIDLDVWLSYLGQTLNDKKSYERMVLGCIERVIIFLDENKDKLISLSDYSLLLKSYGFTEARVGEVFKKLDTDGDENITEDEWRQASHQWFSSNNPDDSGHWLFGNPESLQQHDAVKDC